MLKEEEKGVVVSEKKYWLLGGLIFLWFTIIAFGALMIGCKFGQGDIGGFCYLLDTYFLPGLPYYGVVELFVAFLMYFVIGASIGYILGKVKKRGKGR